MNLKAFGSFFSRRRWILLSLCIITPLGFLCKLFPGPDMWWFRNYGGGVMYEIFWCLAVFLFWPRKQDITKIAIAVLAITCFLEVLQLWHPWFLQRIRSTFLGKTLIGTTFVWWDFPHYLLGCLIGWLWMKGIARIIEDDD